MKGHGQIREDVKRLVVVLIIIMLVINAPKTRCCEVVVTVNCIDCIFVMNHDGCFHYVDTHLGRKPTKESIPEVAQGEGKVFVEEIPAINQNFSSIKTLMLYK